MLNDSYLTSEGDLCVMAVHTYSERQEQFVIDKWQRESHQKIECRKAYAAVEEQRLITLQIEGGEIPWYAEH
jgi:hypothetical protein